MGLINLKNSFQDLNIPVSYTIDSKPERGNDIIGFDELSIRWTENDINKLIQIYPEINKDSIHIKKWVIWICASKDDKNGRYFWEKTICEKRKKADIIGISRQSIDEGINKLSQITIDDLKLEN